MNLTKKTNGKFSMVSKNLNGMFGYVELKNNRVLRITDEASKPKAVLTGQITEDSKKFQGSFVPGGVAVDYKRFGTCIFSASAM